MAKHTKNSRKPDSFLNKPIFEGGITAIRALIKENLKYPKKALAQKIEGSVNIRYDIDYTGKVIKTKVIRGLGHGCDEEAERLVMLFKFKVNKTRKVRVIFHKTIQINFKLPVQKKTPPKSNNKAGLSIQYQVSNSDKVKAKPEPKQAPTTYSYTITVK